MTAQLAEWIAASPQVALACGGFFIGALFGFATRLGNYCAMGAVSDWRLSGDLGRLGSVALAAAVAILGAQSLDAAGITDLSKSMYVQPRINWAGALIGGALFGAGMMYAGGCPSRAVVRIGGGDLRALTVLLTMALAAMATLGGVLGPLRMTLEASTAVDLAAQGYATQDLPTVLASDGLMTPLTRIGTSLLIILPLLIFAMRAARSSVNFANIAAGIAVGLLVTAAWALTGVAHDDMSVSPIAPHALSFVKPVADAFDWIERSSGLGVPSFGAASIFGAFAGSALAAVATRTWRITGFSDSSDFFRHLGGAIAMGVGGILGLGCTIGQGVTGLSTLAVQSLLAVAAIVAGAVAALEHMKRTM